MPSLWDITSIWQILPALAILVPLILYFKTRKIKSLSYLIVTKESLLTVDEKLKQKITVLYENKPIENISLIIIRLLNTGNEPIKSNEFEDPITMSFSPNFCVLGAELIDANPPTINAKIKFENNDVFIEPLLLNKKDSITIKVIGHTIRHIPIPRLMVRQSNEDAYPILKTRIIGISDVIKIGKNDSIKTINVNERIKLNTILNIIIALSLILAIFNLLILFGRYLKLF